jgi:hypothetical protein
MTISEVPDNSITLQPLPPIPQIHREMSGITKTAIAGSKLYPSSRHRTVRKETMDRFHQLVECKDGWTEASQRNNVKVYLMPVQDSPLPIVRGEITILGTWTPEQVCSVIQCFGARKICKLI